MSYGEQAGWTEWSKFVIFKLGNLFGFAQPLIAAVVGCTLFFCSWMYLPGAYKLLLSIPPILAVLRDAEVSLNTLIYINWGLIVLGNFLGICCYCRVACLCYPTIFDRYKIKGVKL